jgi:hypothetical protein
MDLKVPSARIMFLPVLLLALAASPSLLEGQEWDPSSRAPDRGLRLSSVSVASSYYNVSSFNQPVYSPFATYGNALPGAGSDVISSASAALTWQVPGEKTGLSLTYIPTYSAYARNSKWNTFNHSLLISGGRPVRLNSRLALKLSLSADVQDYRHYMFAPGGLENAVAAPATLQDLSAALAGGAITPGSQLAAYLTGSPGGDAPSRALVYGDRMLSAAVQTGLSFQWTPRLSLTVNFGLQRFQHLPGPGGDASLPSAYLVPQTTSGNLGIDAAYEFSPRTAFGLQATETRSFSSLQDAYNTNAMAYIRRNLSRRWFVSLHGGAGIYSDVKTTTVFVPPQGPQWNAIVTTGFKTRTHTVAAGYQRIFADTYGVGGNASSINWAWNWRAPGSGWWLSAGAGRQQFLSGDFANLVSWRGNAGVNRMLTGSLVAQIQYSYISYSGPFAGDRGYRIAQTGVRVAIIWMPRFRPIG